VDGDAEVVGSPVAVSDGEVRECDGGGVHVSVSVGAARSDGEGSDTANPLVAHTPAAGGVMLLADRCGDEAADDAKLKLGVPVAPELVGVASIQAPGSSPRAGTEVVSSASTPAGAARGWRHAVAGAAPSLGDAFRSVPVPAGAGWLRRLAAFIGPGYMVAVGYMDPGNWATDLAGGSAFGYSLLFVVLLSSLIAVFLQALSLRLGMVTGRDLAQACRDSMPRPLVVALWVIAEVAIAATDIAEVIGSAVALKLLVGLPLVWGVLITAADVLVVLALQNRRFRVVEAVVLLLILLITACFIAELAFSRPDSAAVMHHLFVPPSDLLANPDMLYLAVGILGATVMPHNLYLHSAVAQTRAFEADGHRGTRRALRYATCDSTVALSLALFVNAAILILAADAFHRTGNTDVAELETAYALLAPVLGAGAASVLFGVALLAAGQNSTLTGTLAGQVVMEGFLQWRLRPVLRRVITRCMAIVPAVIVATVGGDAAVNRLLVGTQVLLSVALPFAVVPVVIFTSDAAKMGPFVNAWYTKALGWAISLFIIALNGWLLVRLATE